MWLLNCWNNKFRSNQQLSLVFVNAFFLFSFFHFCLWQMRPLINNVQISNFKSVFVWQLTWMCYLIDRNEKSKQSFHTENITRAHRSHYMMVFHPLSVSSKSLSFTFVLVRASNEKKWKKKITTKVDKFKSVCVWHIIIVMEPTIVRQISGQNIKWNERERERSTRKK